MLSQLSCEPQWVIPGRETIHCPPAATAAQWWCMAPSTYLCPSAPPPTPACFWAPPGGIPLEQPHPAAALCGHLHMTKPLQWPECASSNLLDGACWLPGLYTMPPPHLIPRTHKIYTYLFSETFPSARALCKSLRVLSRDFTSHR